MKRPFKRVVLWSAVLVGGMALILIAAAFISGRIGGDRVLLVTVDGELSESPGSNPLAALGGRRSPTLRTVTESIRRGAADGRIVGLLLQVKNAELPMAHIEEIEAAIATFRESGKWNLAFLETAGEFARGGSAYALAACADEVVLAPPGDINLIGLRSSVPFLKGTLDRLKVRARFEQRHEYKNAANTFTKEFLTPAHREAMVALLDDIEGVLVAHLAARRAIDEPRARAWIQAGPFNAAEALETGLVDRLAYWDEIRAEAEEKLDKENPFISLGQYAATGELHERGPTVALIYADGSISRGESADDVAGSDTVTRAFRAARQEEVEGVLFRVASPGGSYIASDLIRREVEVTREAGIPVVVSMGGVAGSGGYFVAMDADHIVAQPSTLTGSIGVFAGSFGVREFWKHWAGLSFDGYSTSDNANLFSWLDLPSETGQKRITAFVDHIYEDFVAKVTAGRSLERAQVEKVARGRVWSGQRALEHGLVDALGGMEVALGKLKELMDMEEDRDVRVMVLPRPKTTLEAFEDALGQVSLVASWIRRGTRVLEAGTAILKTPVEVGAP